MFNVVRIGNQTVTLPLGARTNNVQLQWRALRNGEWSMDNVRIGSDALLYNLQFDIQVGDCSPPPINGSSLDHVSLEYYDGVTWSLLQTECLLLSKCLLTVRINTSTYVNHSCIFLLSLLSFRREVYIRVIDIIRNKELSFHCGH